MDRSTPRVVAPVRYTREQVIAMAADDPEVLRKHVVEAGAEAWISGLVDALKPRDPCYKCGQVRYERWAYRIWAEAAKLVGVTPQIQTLIVQQLGVPVDEAKAAVDAMRGARDLTPEAHYENAMALLDSVLREKPELRERAIRRIQSLSLAAEPGEWQDGSHG